MLQYTTIIQSLREAVPEIDLSERVRGETDPELRALPYCCYFPAFSQLVLEVVADGDSPLLRRCFAFMEEMALSGDSAVQTLLQVEVLEVFFALPWELYRLAVHRYMGPATQRLHQENKASFREPQPPAGTEPGRYRTRAEKKAARKNGPGTDPDRK